jgi:HSP20 family protein
MAQQELQVQQKRELEKKQEATFPTRIFVPPADIFENKEELTVILEMPGADKDAVEIRIEDGTLNVGARLDFSKYQGLHPLYIEYNIGHYSRSFRLSNKIDQNKIEAQMTDGVLTLKLPKSEEAKPRNVQVK